ncbi:MAG: type II toxin-antitoxin system BrnA family antitoxin [Microcoleaceae cyanobacterium]
MKAEQFDKKFDENQEDITQYLDLSRMRRPNKEQKQAINVDFPLWIIEALDSEAQRLGLTRQSMIEEWITERLKQTLMNF